MLVFLFLGAGCKDRRIKKSVPQKDVNELVDAIKGPAERGKTGQLEQTAPRSKVTRRKTTPLVRRKFPPEPADLPIDVESAKYLNFWGQLNVPKLLELVKHTNPAVRYQALAKLSRLNPPPANLLPVAVASLKDPRSKVRLVAAQLIAKYDTDAKSAVPALMEALKDHDSMVSLFAAEALTATGDLPDKTLPVLIALLSDENCPHKAPVIRLIGTFGPKASSVTPLLIPHLSSWIAGRRAAETLGRIGAYRVLIEKANRSQLTIRHNALHGLGYVQPTPDAVIKTLLSFANSNDIQSRQHVAESLGLVRPTTEPVVAALGRLTKDQNPFVQQSAAESLGTIEP
jgi:HEAT repeat protein